MDSMSERLQSRGEEIANSVSHGMALVAALVGAPFLIGAANNVGTVNVVGASIFALSMVLLFLSSTIYHALRDGRLKRLFQKLDHGAIYIFIAASYTPFALGAMVGSTGWMLFGIVWTMAIVGTVLKVCNRLSKPWLSTGLYLVMGWLVLIAALPLAEHVPGPGIALLVAGGGFYTVGCAFFLLDSHIRYAHTIWHGFVAAGTSFHYFAVLHFAN